ncbi:hypothetical protein [Glutamicibacter sp. NPDC127525]|uniref:hypothetical protein n=1 Tax=unclassified Glutamicibacter TaxID=2627139 RepID=UPI00363F5C7F
MNTSTLDDPAGKFQPQSIAHRAADTSEPQNHWAWTGWMPEEEHGISMLAA